jgi:uncharacterized protein (DUF2267 family)
MGTDDFYGTVQLKGELASNETAADATRATLTTLAERITSGEADDLAAELPDVVGDMLTNVDPSEAEEFSREEFLHRVEDRADVDDPLTAARAVAAALDEHASDAELENAREQLPGEFDVILEPSLGLDADEFYDAVAERGGPKPRDEARTATAATLETLAERLAGGEARDLATYVPGDLDVPLKDAEGDPPGFGVDEFVARVADRADVDEDTAAEYARAVTDAVAESASEAEYESVISQLPGEYGSVFRSPDAAEGE